MSNNRIRNRMRAVLREDTLTSEQLSSIEKTLRENMTKAGEQAMRSLLFFIALASAWVLIKFAYIRSIEVLDMELGDPQVALLVLPPIAAFAFYQYQCFMLLADSSLGLLGELYKEKLAAFAEQRLEAFLTYPTFLAIELSISNLVGNKAFLGKTAETWVITLALVFTFVPTVFLLWVCYSLINAPMIGIGWSIASSFLVVLLLVRALLVFIHWVASSDPENKSA